jgi:hypothetical protein
MRMPRKRAVDLVVLIVALALVAVLGALRSAQNTAQQSEPSTYDTGVNGYAALYDVLAREGTRVERFERPIAELTHGDGALVIAGKGALSAAAASPGAPAFLDRWVRGGGKLVILGDSGGQAVVRALGLPKVHRFKTLNRAVAACAFARSVRGAQIAGIFDGGYTRACEPKRASVFAAGSYAAGIAYTRGRGTVVLVATPTVFDNLHVAQKANARAAYALLGDTSVAFDERVHGYAAGRTFWEVLPQPMRIAIGIALGAVLLAILGANLPSAPPYEVRAPEERDSGAYIASLARMLERGGAAHEAIRRIAERCDRALSGRPNDERARMLLRELRTLEATPRPGPHDVLQAGRIFARVRKDYGC